MRVLMINNEYPPIGGGTGSVNQYLLREFKNHKDITIDLITSSGTNQASIEKIHDSINIHKISLKRDDIHHASNLELIMFIFLSFFYSRKLLSKEGYNCIFAWSTVPSGFTALLLSFIFKIPYIVRVSGPDVPGFETRYNLITKILKPLLKQIWGNAHTVICKSAFEKDAVSALSPTANINLIPNGVSLSQQKIKTNYELHSPIKLISVGRLIERKRQDTIIQTIKLLRDEGIETELHLVGEGDFKDSLISLTKELNLESSIIFHGYVTREGIPLLLSKSDCFVLATERDSMSVATLEAISSSLPLVVTEECGLDDLLKNNETALTFNFDSPKSLAEVLKSFFADEKKRESLAVNMRKETESITWPAIAERYYNLFLSI